MRFAAPYWLVLGWAACLLMLWRYRCFDRSQRGALTRFISPRLATQLTRSLSTARRTAKRALVIAGVMWLFIALARPQAGYRWAETQHKGRDILFAIDTSKSMLTPDVKPNRLARAKLAVEDLLDKLNGDGAGLIAFAGNAFLQCPVTLDYDAFRDSLEALDTSTIPRGGTDIASAIREAQNDFKTRANSDKVLILLSDGEDLSGDAITAARAAGNEGVMIFTVGVGTASAALIPIAGDEGATGFVKDPAGNFVKSRLDEATLRQIAQVTGGIYAPLGQRGEGLVTIYNQGLTRFARHELAARRHKVFFEQFKWPLLAGLLCLVADWFIGTRRREQRPATVWEQRSVIEATPSREQLAGILGLTLLLAAWPGTAQASPQSAEKAYFKGNFAQARQEYAATSARKPSDAKLQFNLGAAAYKAGDFNAAAKSFADALKTDQVPVQEAAYYNLGNAQYRLGQHAEKASPEQVAQLWQQAVKSYDTALEIKPDDVNAKFNRALVKKKLEELKEEQQQRQQQQSSQNKQEKDQQNRDQQQNQGQPSRSGSDKAQQNQPSAKQQPPRQGPQKPQQSNSNQQNARNNQDQNPASAAKPQPDKQNPPENKANGSQEPLKQEQAQVEANARWAADEMTPEEARNLLNSLRDEQRHLPVAPLSPRADNAQEEPPLKDW